MSDHTPRKRTRATPKRKGRRPADSSAFASEVLATNVRAYRALRGLTQEGLAERMVSMGHEWSAGILGFVERHDRVVGVDELVGLAIALEVTIGDLLDPTGPDGRRRLGLDLGDIRPESGAYLSGPLASAFVHGNSILGYSPGSLWVEPVEGGEAETGTAIQRHMEEMRGLASRPTSPPAQ